jgi:hypothetical protein
MNELLGVIFYVNRDSSDSFWAFNSLMSQLSDIFTAEVDSTEGGIYSRIDEIRRLLGDYDYKLSKRLEKSDFPFATICLRWLTTMMAFDLTLPDTMHLWDIALQAIPSHDLVRFTSCICAAYLMQTSGMVYTLHDDQDVIQTISGFGKSCAFDIDDLVTRSLAVYAFESTLRGQYVPNSDEPVLEALGEAVESATNKVLSVIESVNADQVREEVQEKMSKARDFVTSVNTEKVQEKLTQARIFVSSWLSGFATPPKIDDTTTQQDEVPDDKNQQKQS